MMGASIDNVGHSVTHFLFVDGCFIVSRAADLTASYRAILYSEWLVYKS